MSGGPVSTRPVPYLFDCRPGQIETDAWELVDLVRRGGGEGSDIRMLVDDAEAWLEALGEVTDILRCDVYLCPPGATLMARNGDLVAIDPITSAPIDWLVLRPRDVPSHYPTWFDRRNGRLVTRAGLVTLLVPHGLAFATRRTFYDLAAICDDLADSGTGHATTIACATRSGQFEIGWYHGPEAGLSGSDFARLINASSDHVQANVRLVMDWPEDPAERSAVEANVRQFAEALGRTVWVPSHESAAALGPAVRSEVQWELVTTKAPSPDWPPEHMQALRHVDEALRVLRFDHPDEATVLRQAAAVWSEYVPAFEQWLRTGQRESAENDQLIELRRQLMAVPAHELSPSSIDDSDQPYAGPVVTVPNEAAPALGLPRRRPHGIDWLPPRPWTNAAPIELFVWSSYEPMQLAESGLPTADVFLLASSDLVRICRGHRTGHVLRLMIPPGSAVELSAHAEQAPARLQHRVRESWTSHLIPLGWLPEVNVREVSFLDGRAEPGETRPWTGGGLHVRFVGAAHGVPGLPPEVVRWPARRQRARAHLTLPHNPDIIMARMQAHPGWLPLYHHTPHVPAGHYLLELDIEQRAAIDVPATLAALAGIPVGAPSLWSFNGVELVLPARDFARTSVIKVHPAGPNAANLHPGQTLADILQTATAQDATGASAGFG